MDAEICDGYRDGKAATCRTLKNAVGEHHLHGMSVWLFRLWHNVAKICSSSSLFSICKEQTENRDIRENAGKSKVLKHMWGVSRLLADRELKKSRDQKKTWNDRSRESRELIQGPLGLNLQKYETAKISWIENFK